jgi:hypothetical protein
MNLDLNELVAGWDCPRGQICARLVIGRDGCELVQLRVDLGVLQMFPDERPDGVHPHGLPTIRAHIGHQLRTGRCLNTDDWRELERELTQINYRRLAYSGLAEDALRVDDDATARSYLARALRDVDACLECLRMLQNGPESACVSLRPMLVFNRARLASQLAVTEGRHEEAVEELEAGAARLEQLLAERAGEDERRPEDPGVGYLRQVSQRLRKQHGIERTLRERLEAAIEGEDFEQAARLRDELRRRKGQAPPSPT